MIFTGMDCSMIHDENSFSSLRPAEPDKPFLLAADIDGTLLGDAEGEACLQAFARNYPGAFYLAVITGRALSSVQELVCGKRLPPPDYIGSAVGTELFACDDPRNALGCKYAAQVGADWDLETIYALGEGEGIRRQELNEGQPRFQAGFYWDGLAKTLAALRSRLGGQKGCSILPSSEMRVEELETFHSGRHPWAD